MDFLFVFFLFISILIDLFIYHFRGRNVIKRIYFKKEPKYKINKFKKVELNLNFQVNNLKKKNIKKKKKRKKRKKKLK